MGCAVTFEFDHPRMLLGSTIKNHQSAGIQILYTTPTSADNFCAFVGVSCDESTDVEQSLTNDASISDWSVICHAADFNIYKIVYPHPAIDVYAEAAKLGGVIQRTWAEDGNWVVQGYLPSRALIGPVKKLIEGTDCKYTLRTLRATDEFQTNPVLSPQQEQLLRDAWERGYFEVPREVSQGELADTHDISESAVSQALRRSLNTLLAHQFKDSDTAFVPGMFSPFEEE